MADPAEQVVRAHPLYCVPLIFQYDNQAAPPLLICFRISVCRAFKLWHTGILHDTGISEGGTTMKKIGVVLSGCGVYDGSEIHEAVLTLLAIDRQGCEALCMAPNIDVPTVNHLTGQTADGLRNVLVESARIARGKIRDISEIAAADLDAIIFPGGFGAAKNLCDFAFKGSAATVNPEVARLLKEMAEAGKPIGAVCIAPALVAAALGGKFAPILTIGSDAETAAEINKTGAQHQSCPVTELVIDTKNKLVTSPAYMLAANISEVAEGIEKTVAEVIKLI
jgi:enhancing lycopene biosynthesis protein 2